MNNNNQQTFTTLLQTSLSTIFHQLLYSRIIYPPDSFILHRYNGVRCHASRVPSVSRYIREFLEVAIPCVVRIGGVHSLFLIVMEEDVDDGDTSGMVVTKVLERFEFRFDLEESIGGGKDWMDVDTANDCTSDGSGAKNKKAKAFMKCNAQIVNEARTHLEYSMKQCLLAVLALERRKKRIGEKPQNLSFKLCMRTTDGANKADWVQKCPQLMKAVQDGLWYEPNPSTCLVSREGASQTDGGVVKRGLYRPIKDVKIAACGMSLSLGMEVT